MEKEKALQAVMRAQAVVEATQAQAAEAVEGRAQAFREAREAGVTWREIGAASGGMSISQAQASSYSYEERVRRRAEVRKT